MELEELEIDAPKKKVARKVAKKKQSVKEQKAEEKSALASFIDEPISDGHDYEEIRETIGDAIWWTNPDGEEIELGPFTAMCQIWFARLRNLVDYGDIGSIYLVIYLLTHDYKATSKLYRNLRVRRELIDGESVEVVVRGELLEDIEEWINATFDNISDSSLEEASRVFNEVFLRQAAAQTKPEEKGSSEGKP